MDGLDGDEVEALLILLSRDLENTEVVGCPSVGDSSSNDRSVPGKGAGQVVEDEKVVGLLSSISHA